MAAARGQVRYQVGELTVALVRDGRFRLDGGAMFGVVPRALWAERSPPDDENRIQLAFNAVLVDTGGCRILIDPGVGVHHDPTFATRFAVEHPPTVWESLAAAGIEAESIDYVVDSHLHWDHAGANVRPVHQLGAGVKGDAASVGSASPAHRGAAGAQLELAFPSARYVVQRAEWEQATHPHERNRASYRDEDFRLLEKTGQLLLVDGEYELAHGVRLVPAPGHTGGLQLLRASSSGETFLYLADLVPTRHHLDYPWIMAYDLYPMETLAQKKHLLPEAARGDWLVGFGHDPDQPFGRVRLEGSPGRQRPVFVPA